MARKNKVIYMRWKKRRRETGINVFKNRLMRVIIYVFN